MSRSALSSALGCSLAFIAGGVLAALLLAVGSLLWYWPQLSRGVSPVPSSSHSGGVGTRESALPLASSSRPAGPGSAAAPVGPGIPIAPAPEWTAEDDLTYDSIAEQRVALFRKMKKYLGLSAEALKETERLFSTQKWMGQGNPESTRHPMTQAKCRDIRRGHPGIPGDPVRCGAKNMVALYNRRANQTAQDAQVCIDQYEYPNIECEYPVTWVPAHIAQGLCVAQGKRLCDAHEWEGACAGSVLPAAEEYAWNARKFEDVNTRRLASEYEHNRTREIVWAYGPEKNHAKCATGSRKSDGCVTPTWELCGTNTYPAGSFPDCVSPLGAYDLHGNAAEHMNLPMAEDELASRGNTLGQTEMKGSWFIFTRYEAHIDDCRWRAPSWHGGRVMASNSHMNYHLGFRCCKDLGRDSGGAAPPAVADGSAGGGDAGAGDAGAGQLRVPSASPDAGSTSNGSVF